MPSKSHLCDAFCEQVMSTNRAQDERQSDQIRYNKGSNPRSRDTTSRLGEQTKSRRTCSPVEEMQRQTYVLK